MMIRITAYLFYKFYGYEAINLLFRILPSRFVVKILRQFGAQVGENVRILSPFCIHNADGLKPIFQNLVIGNEVFIGRYAFIDLACKVTIGDRTTISHHCSLHTHMDVGDYNLLKNIFPKTYKPILIESDVYLGANTSVLNGVAICQKTIIGANSLVIKNITIPGIYFGSPVSFKKIK